MQTEHLAHGLPPPTPAGCGVPGRPGRCTRGQLPSSRPSTTADLSRRSRGPQGHEEPRPPRRRWRTGSVHIATLETVPSPNPPGQRTLGGRQPEERGPGVGHPTSGPCARSSRGWRARARGAPPGHYLARPSPSRPGPDGDSTPRAVPLGSQSPGGGGDVARGSPVCSEQLPGRGSQPSRAERAPSVRPSVLWARPLGLWAAARRPSLRTVITSGETPNSSRGRARLSSTPPGGVGLVVAVVAVVVGGEPTLRPSPRAGNTPAPGANSSSRDKNVPARHGTAASAPHALAPPAARAAFRPRAARAPGLTVSSAAANRRRGPGRAGPDTIWQSTAAAPAAPSSRLRDTQPRAGSGSCGGGRRSTTSPSLPSRSLARFLPSSPPRCHGNAAPRRLAPPLLPPRLPRPAQASLPARPLPGRRPPPPGCPEGGWGGKVASGRAGRAREPGWGRPGPRAQPSGREKAKPSPVPPEGPMGGRRRRGAAAEWTSWRGASEGVLPPRVCPGCCDGQAQPWVPSSPPRLSTVGQALKVGERPSSLSGDRATLPSRRGNSL